MKMVKGALVASILGAGLLAAAPHAAAIPLHEGHCLFGHVNPRDQNSACRGSDSANWPHVPADVNGHPLKECLPGNEELWEWKEVLLGRSR